MDSQTSRRLLIGILQLAWSGELAASYAYQGHWNSVGNPEEKSRIRTIEEEEWHHRKLVGEMLWDLGEHPGSWREFKAVIIGRTAGFLCHVTGWLAPMYGAGKLESRNVREYEVAARYARDCGRREFVEPLLTMAEVEWEHEKYFRAQVLKSALGRRLPMWQAPPPKENIRVSFTEAGACGMAAWVRRQYSAAKEDSDMDVAVSTGYGIGWGTLALINAGLAQGKGRSGLVWFFVSLFLGPVATFLILLLDRKAV